MGGTMSEFGERVSIAYFSEQIGVQPPLSRLAAVIAWRKAGSPIQEVRLPFWRRVASLFSSPRVPDHTETSLPEGWSGGTGTGQDQVLFDSRRGVLRVRGRDFESPSDGRTLIVLIDEDAVPPGREPVFTLHSMDSPVLPQFSWDHSLSKKRNLKQMMKSNMEEGKAIRLAVRNEPVVRAFLERPD